MVKKVVASVGLPNSGKSTWAKQTSDETGWPIVSKDSIRLALHGQKFSDEAEPWISVMAQTMIKSLFYSGHEIVIVEECNCNSEDRYEWMSDEWKTEFVLIGTPKEECLRRADMDEEYGIKPIIEREFERWEDPPEIMTYTYKV